MISLQAFCSSSFKVCRHPGVQDSCRLISQHFVWKICLKTLAHGLVYAYLVRKAKSKPTSIPVFHKSLFPVEGSAILMLTLLDLFQFLALLIIFLPWILILDSQRLSLSHQSLQLGVLRLCSGSTLRMGFSGLEFHQSLLQIVKHSSPPLCGKNCACSLESLIQRQPCSILRVMLWLKDLPIPWRVFFVPS